jgi:molybdopterin converting factor small subunit
MIREYYIMAVIIKFGGPITKRLNNPTFSIEIQKGSNIREIMHILFEKEKVVKEIWTDVEKMERDAMVLVNDVDIGLTGGLDTIVKQGDQLTVLPLVHGG